MGSKPVGSKHSSMVSAAVPTLNSLPDFPSGRTVIGACKPNKLFPPKAAVGHFIYLAQQQKSNLRDWLCRTVWWGMDLISSMNSEKVPKGSYNKKACL